MGKIKQGMICSVDGCNEKATRSFAADKAKEALQPTGASLKDERARRVYLCQKHYKSFKKQTKQEKKLDKWRYGAK
ncbi:MAG: hypothetical protein ACFFD8_04020 [Candidatus Thorarchaeota archaeon]